MAISVCPAPTAAERWIKGVERHATEFILDGTTAVAIRQGIGISSGDIRTVHKTRGNGLGVALPLAVRRDLGIGEGDLLQFWPADEGAVLLQRVDAATLRPLERIGVDRLAEIGEAARPKPRIAHHELRCQQCGEVFCWRTTLKRFCSACAHVRQAKTRRRWRRRHSQAVALALAKARAARRRLAVSAPTSGFRHRRRIKPTRATGGQAASRDRRPVRKHG